jgi:hypothetical protein
VKNQTVWHYTTGHLLAKILADGYIRPAAESVVLDERPVVWFSGNPFFEMTALKGIVDSRTGHRRTATMEEMFRVGGGLGRIEVAQSAAPLGWRKIQRKAHIDPGFARALQHTAHKVGSDPNEWLGSLTAVPRQKWLSVETFNLEEPGLGPL